jgi:hypothetical protein
LKITKEEKFSWVWWHTTVIPAFGRLWQEDREFQASKDHLERACFRKENNKRSKALG